MRFSARYQGELPVMRALCLLLSVLLHVAVALALPPRAQRCEPVPRRTPQSLVWLVQSAPLRRIAKPVVPALSASADSRPAPAATPPRPSRLPARRRVAQHHQRRPAAPALPLALAPAVAAGVAVPHSEAAEPAGPGPVPAASAVGGLGVVEPSTAASGNASEAFASGGDAPTELDGRSGDVNAEVAAWLRALRAHLRRVHRYPDWLAERGLEGTVELRLLILADGRLDTVMSAGAGNPLLVQAAKEVLTDAGRLPKPPSVLGAAARVRMPLTFRLNDALTR